MLWPHKKRSYETTMSTSGRSPFFSSSVLLRKLATLILFSILSLNGEGLAFGHPSIVRLYKVKSQKHAPSQTTEWISRPFTDH